MRRLKWPESRDTDTATKEFFYRVKKALPLLIYNDYVTQRRMSQSAVMGTPQKEQQILGLDAEESSP